MAYPNFIQPQTPRLRDIIKRELLRPLHILYMHLRFRRLSRHIVEPVQYLPLFRVYYSLRMPAKDSERSLLKLQKILRAAKNDTSSPSFSNIVTNSSTATPYANTNLSTSSFTNTIASSPTNNNGSAAKSTRKETSTSTSETKSHPTPIPSTPDAWMRNPGLFKLPVIHNKELLERALTFKRKEMNVEDVQNSFRQLAFLGDSLIYSEFVLILQEIFPHIQLRHIAILRARLATREQLARFSEKCGLSKMVKSSPASDPIDVQGECMEAYIGALFLDRGPDGPAEVRKLLRTFVRWFVDENEEKLKSSQEKSIQEWDQSKKPQEKSRDQ
ncbi:8175_t:CDS:1, partial [Ambispora gerdemannii]